jgi:hypothetical protein
MARRELGETESLQADSRGQTCRNSASEIIGGAAGRPYEQRSSSGIAGEEEITGRGQTISREG